LWLQELNGLLQLEDPTLKSQYEALDGALRLEPVAFWLRVYIVSHVTLGEIRKLRLLRAAAAEPDYARELNETLQHQLHASAEAVQSLCQDIDRYLRRSDIAEGLEELSLRRKAKVRRLRRQLWEVDEQLKESLEATRGMYEAVPSLEPIEVPAALGRRTVEPWVVRDSMYDAAVKATDVGTEALASTADRGAKALRGLADRRRAVREADEPVKTEARSSLSSAHAEPMPFSTTPCDLTLASRGVNSTGHGRGAMSGRSQTGRSPKPRFSPVSISLVASRPAGTELAVRGAASTGAPEPCPCHQRGVIGSIPRFRGARAVPDGSALISWAPRVEPRREGSRRGI
jgi:hypothetical protein